MHIGADYGTIYKWIKFIFGTLMYLYIPHTMLNFEVNIFNSSGVINILCSYPRLSWAAYHECRRGGNLLG